MATNAKLALINPLATLPPPVSITQAERALREALEDPAAAVRIGLKATMMTVRKGTAYLVILFAQQPLQGLALVLATSFMHQGFRYAILPPTAPIRKRLAKNRERCLPVAATIVGPQGAKDEAENMPRFGGGGGGEDLVRVYRYPLKGTAGKKCSSRNGS